MPPNTHQSILFRPSIPSGMFPIASKVFFGGDAPPSTVEHGCRVPDIYIGNSTLHIVKDGEWIPWDPLLPLELDIDSDICFAAPCISRGFQIVDTIHESNAKIELAIKWLRESGSDSNIAGNSVQIFASLLRGENNAGTSTKSEEKDGNSQESRPGPTTQLRVMRSHARTSAANKAVTNAVEGSSKVPLERQIQTCAEVDEQKTIFVRRDGRVYMKQTVGGLKRKPEMEPSIVEAETSSKGKQRDKQRDVHCDTMCDTNKTVLTQEKRRKVAENDGIEPKLKSLLSGISCPRNTPIVEWNILQVSTYGPWFSDRDLKIVKRMSSAPRAQECMYDANRPMVVELSYTPHVDMVRNLILQIEDALSRGCAVLVRGWEPGLPLEFSVDDIRMYRPTMPQDVTVQDAIVRGKEQVKRNGDPTNIHKTMTLEEFIRLADEEGECNNLLDLPNTQPDVPPFVIPLSDNVNSKSVIMNDCYVRKVGPNKQKTFFGTQAIQGDSERLRGWDLLTHGGFFTYPHHDAAGLCTYVTVRSGTKIWGYVDTPKSSKKDRKDILEEWDKLFTGFVESPSKFPVGTVVLERGDTLIQPPGSNHLVYTPQDGMTSGGHFLSYSTLHLTELALAYDCSTFPRSKMMRGSVATNSTHPSIARYIVWMVLSLPKLAEDEARTYRLRSILALITIMENGAKYTDPEVRKQTPVGPTGDIMDVEIQEERAAAMKIIEHLKISLKVVDAAAQLCEGPWWEVGPICNLSEIFASYK